MVLIVRTLEGGALNTQIDSHGVVGSSQHRQDFRIGCRASQKKRPGNMAREGSAGLGGRENFQVFERAKSIPR